MNMNTPDVRSICHALAQAWETLGTGQANLPLPANVFLLPLTELRGRPVKSVEPLGHFARSRWIQRPDGVHEVALHPGLFHNTENLLLVLLHEAAHCLLLDCNGGCSPNGYYHRKEYRNQCWDLGLRCEFTDTRYGWNNTRWPENGIPARYEEALEVLRSQLTLMAATPMSVPNRAGIPLPPSGRIPMTCRCFRPRRIYVARGAALTGGIRCEFCGELFAASEN